MFIREGRVIPVQTNLKGVLSTKDLDNVFDLKIGLKRLWNGDYWATGYLMVVEKFSDERIIECVEKGCLAEVEVDVYCDEEEIRMQIEILSKNEEEGERRREKEEKEGMGENGKREEGRRKVNEREWKKEGTRRDDNRVKRREERMRKMRKQREEGRRRWREERGQWQEGSRRIVIQKLTFFGLDEKEIRELVRLSEVIIEINDQRNKKNIKWLDGVLVINLKEELWWEEEIQLQMKVIKEKGISTDGVIAISLLLYGILYFFVLIKN